MMEKANEDNAVMATKNYTDNLIQLQNAINTLKVDTQVSAPSGRHRKHTASSDKDSQGKCRRCGRSNHLARNCRSRRHKNGRVLLDKRKLEEQKEATQQCSRCKRHGHFHHECYSQFHADGSRITALTTQPNIVRTISKRKSLERRWSF
jgi:hypothetical protein